MVLIFQIRRVFSTSSDNKHDDDGEGTEIIPERTYVGVRCAFGKQFPWAIEPLKLFGGLIIIPEYIYRYKLSMAKIQLMSMDVSRIEYDKNDKKDKSSGNTKVDQRAIDLNAESVKKHKQRLAKQKIEEAIPIDITDKFNNI